MGKREALLQDITDPELKSEINTILDAFDRDEVESIMEDILEEAKESYKISRADREAIAKEASKRMETFFKGTVLVGYIDLRRQIKASQREIAAARKDIDQQSKQMATKDQLEAVERNLDARIQVGLKGPIGSDRSKSMREFYDQVEETAENVEKIMKHLGIN